MTLPLSPDALLGATLFRTKGSLKPKRPELTCNDGSCNTSLSFGSLPRMAVSPVYSRFIFQPKQDLVHLLQLSPFTPNCSSQSLA